MPGEPGKDEAVDLTVKATGGEYYCNRKIPKLGSTALRRCTTPRLLEMQAIMDNSMASATLKSRADRRV